MKLTDIFRKAPFNIEVADLRLNEYPGSNLAFVSVKEKYSSGDISPN